MLARLTYGDAPVDCGTRLEALYVLALTLGIRQGELLALRWRDVSFDRGTVTISGTAGFDNDGNLSRGSPIDGTRPPNPAAFATGAGCHT